MSRTYHSISLCFPNERDDSRSNLEDMYSDLKRFNHFRPNFSSIRISPNGRTAHFYLDNTMLALASVPAGSIDVELVRRPERNEVYAVTTGIHPLVGVRRWRVHELFTRAIAQGNFWWRPKLMSRPTDCLIGQVIRSRQYVQEQKCGRITSRISVDTGKRLKRRFPLTIKRSLAEVLTIP